MLSVPEVCSVLQIVVDGNPFSKSEEMENKICMRSKVPANAFWLAEPGYRPRFTDGEYVCLGLTKAFYDLVEELSIELNKHDYSSGSLRTVRPPLIPDIGDFYSRGIFASIRVASPKVQRLLNRIFAETQAEIIQTHKRGVERGKALLVQLAKGSLTVGEFNDTITKADDT